VVITGWPTGEAHRARVRCGATLYEKTIRGSLFGSGNPQRDIVKMLDLYQAGVLKLDELVTRRYSLEEVNQGYTDLVEGRNIRGVVVHDA